MFKQILHMFVPSIPYNPKSSLHSTKNTITKISSFIWDYGETNSDSIALVTSLTSP